MNNTMNNDNIHPDIHIDSFQFSMVFLPVFGVNFQISRWPVAVGLGPPVPDAAAAAAAQRGDLWRQHQRLRQGQRLEGGLGAVGRADG